MDYELKEIKELRKKFNLTQSELAKKSGVSQSLIARGWNRKQRLRKERNGEILRGLLK